MNAATSTAIKGGFFIGLAILVWLYLAYYLGLHTSGIWVFQVFIFIWVAISLTGYILILKAVRRRSERWTYWSGLRAGFMAAFVSMLMSLVAQVGYAAFTLQNDAIQSAFAALFVGIVLSAIIMIFLRQKKMAEG